MIGGKRILFFFLVLYNLIMVNFERQTSNPGESGNDFEDLEKRVNADRQQRKIQAFLTTKDVKYINARDVEITPEYEEYFFEQMESGAITEDDEREMLATISSPVNKIGVDNVYRGIEGLDVVGRKHEKRILSYVTKGDFYGVGDVSEESVENFLGKYPLPMDFEQASEDFLRIIRVNNPEPKYQEYKGAMDDFKARMYGKRQEYWDQMKDLRRQAEERRAPKNFEKDSLKLDFGVAEMEKNATKGIESGRLTEDAHFERPEEGIFAVFDGAGGMGGGRLASQTCVNELSGIMDREKLENSQDLAGVLDRISDKVIETDGAGMATGLICRVKEENGEKVVYFATVGDSRLYVVRGGIGYQMTKDEGYGNVITNALGSKDCKTRQAGKVSLMAGDKLVLCSDGITGDFEPDLMSGEELGGIVVGAGSEQEAAENLVKSARKKDDRTAIVVGV